MIGRELGDQALEKMAVTLGTIPRSHLVWALGCTLGSYGAISLYDWLGFVACGAPMAYGKTLFVSLITYTISPTVGLAFFTGGALRYRYYLAWGSGGVTVARVIIFTNVALWLGLGAIAGGLWASGVVTWPPGLGLPWPLSVWPLKVVGWGILALLGLYLLALRQRWPGIPKFLGSEAMAIAQIAVFILDWGLAAAALYGLFGLPETIGFLQFFGIYSLAMVAGLISAVPGGLGVFEVVLLESLGGTFTAPHILSVLLVFRGIYYLLPLAIALVLLGGYEWRSQQR